MVTPWHAAVCTQGPLREAKPRSKAHAGPILSRAAVVSVLRCAVPFRTQGPLREYLQAMVPHMPPAHRAFLARLSANNSNIRSGSKTVHSSGSNSSSSSGGGACGSSTAGGAAGGTADGANVRDFVMSYGGCRTGELRDAYDEAVGELERFRTAHRAMAAAYIMQQHAGGGGGGSGQQPQGRQQEQQQNHHQHHPAAAGGAAGAGAAGNPALTGQTAAAAVAAGTASPAAPTCTALSGSSNGSHSSSSTTTTTTTGSRASPGADGQAVGPSQHGGSGDTGAPPHRMVGAANAVVPTSPAATVGTAAAERGATFITAAFRTAINAVRALSRHGQERSLSGDTFTTTPSPISTSTTTSSRGSSNHIVAVWAGAGKGQAQGQGQAQAQGAHREEGVLVAAEATEEQLLLPEEAAAGPVGTGGSNVLPALTTFRDTTARHRLREGLHRGGV